MTIELATTFEGHSLRVLRWKERFVWIASEVARAMGYSNPSKLTEKIAGSWAIDFIEGVDFEVLRGDDLGRFRDVLPESGTAPRGRLPESGGRLLVLFESGLHMALLKARVAKSIALRRFLVTEVLPKLARGESVPAASSPSLSALEVPVSAEVLRKLQTATGDGPMVPAQVAATVLHAWARKLDDAEPSDAADKLAAISGHLCAMRHWVIEQFSQEIEQLAHKAAADAGLGILGKVPASERRQLEHELRPHANALGISVGDLTARLCRVWLDASKPLATKELAAPRGASHEKPFRKR